MPIKNGLWETSIEWNFSNIGLDLLIVETLSKNQIPDNYVNQFEKRSKSLSSDFKINPLCILSLVSDMSGKTISTVSLQQALPKELYELYQRISTDYKIGSVFGISDSKRDIDPQLNKELKKYSEIVKTINISYNEISINDEIGYIVYIPSDVFPEFKLLSTGNVIIDYLDDIINLFNIGKVAKKTKIFSPIEKLLAPYYFYASKISQKIFIGSEYYHRFNKSSEYFHNNEFEHCITTVGKLCESSLATIYETLFREYVSDGGTIGQILNSIDSKIRVMLKIQKPKKPADFDEIFSLCKKLDKKESLNTNEILSIARLTAKLIKEDREYNKASNKKINKNENSIFPGYIRDHLKGLLNFRNSASHNSGIYLSQTDALKVLYYYLSLFTWWEQTCKEINWDLSQNEIIQSLIESNK